jgi:hypothetical protein
MSGLRGAGVGKKGETRKSNAMVKIIQNSTKEEK